VAETVYIGIGSNLGDREGNLLRAVAELGRDSDITVTGLSRFYDTDPVGPVPQPPFLNAVARIETSLTPRALLTVLQRVETDTFGRRRQVPQGPREMDLDILFYGSLVLREEGLIIPHPRAHERGFVLVPLSELAPDVTHPLLKVTVAELAATLTDTKGVRPL
jgi:2-amino-4-hydroxy-6-hydroxymethyldihydropteridine diphosphokinase